MNEEIMEMTEVMEDVVIDDVATENGSGLGKGLLIGTLLVGAGVAAYKFGRKALLKRKAKKQVEVEYDLDDKELEVIDENVG